MLKSLTTLLALGSVTSGLSIEKRAALDTYIANERPIALQGVLNNIGPAPVNASVGVVIAAPGVLNPDYRYSWVRDSALTLYALIEEFLAGNGALQTTIENYLHAEAIRQTIINPSGELYPWGTGLGEPKFQINLTRFNGVWGRPQRDGPALRAISVMQYMDYLLQNGKSAHAINDLWPIVSNDLTYVAMYWNQVGYDLWEEVAGLSFFTIQSQYRSLAQGGLMAQRIGKQCQGCQAQAANIGCFLATNFWNATGGYIIANIDQPSGTTRSGIDSNVITGAIENFDIDGSCDNRGYQPCSSRVLATHKVYVDSFRKLYPINAGYAANAAVATGRYPEDTYYGGNPWFICTLGAAEVLYDAAAQFRKQGQLTIDSTSLAFFQQFYPSAAVGTYKAPNGWCSNWGGNNNCNWGMSCNQPWGSPSSGMSGGSNDFTNILAAMTTYADGFVAVVEKYTPANGTFSEQYNRTTGQLLSAYDLTWSLASFLTCSQRRAGLYPASWHSRYAGRLPASCPSALPADNYVGNYAPATAEGAPAVSMACTVQVTFNVNASTTFGQNVYITGDQPVLGNWAPGYAPMSPDYYTSARALWYYIADLPPSTTIHYKYVHQNSDNYAFEVTNRTVTTPACGNGRVQIATNDAFSAEGTKVYTNFCNPDVTHCY